MLELDAHQVAALTDAEHEHFVRRVHAEVTEKFQDAATSDLLHRMQAAHRHALAMALSPVARTQFLYQEAFAPGFYRHPAIRDWLLQPGANTEQRWADFMAASTHLPEPP